MPQDERHTARDADTWSQNHPEQLLYTQLVDFKDDEYTVKVAKSEKEACQLVAAGIEYACDYNVDKIFKKRK